MLEPKGDVSIEVSGRMAPRMRYPHAFAFLDGNPEPQSKRDVDRLIRLMAYDMISVQGCRGMDPAGVYASCLRTIHQLSANGAPSWEWTSGDLHFRASTCPEEKFISPDRVTVHSDGAEMHELCHWAARLEGCEVPEFPAESGENKLGYPSPAVAIHAAAVMAVEAAQAICGPQRVSVWFENEAHQCLLLELWNEKTSKYSYLER